MKSSVRGRLCQLLMALTWLGTSLLALVFDRGCGRQALADTITLRNGMQLQGDVGKIASVFENPLNSKKDPEAPTPIVFTDDQLRRTYFPSKQVRLDGVVPTNQIQEKIKITKRVAKGTKKIGMVGPVIRISPFDDLGNRTFTMQSSQGPLSVIHGITEVTPHYSRIEGLQVEQALMWDMRVATHSLSRDALSKILRRGVDISKPDEWLRIVRLYTQAERFEDARLELADLLVAFPELAGEFKKQERELLQLSANRLLSEGELRRTVGQHRLTFDMLSNFPAQGIAGETLVKVRELLGEYEEGFKQGKQVVDSLETVAKNITNTVNRQRVEVIVKEMRTEINFNTLPRMADYLRLADDEQMTANQKLALAVSGWILGSGAATDNLTVALELFEIRDLVRSYLRSRESGERTQILDALSSLGGATPANVSRIISQMKPPLDLPEPPSEAPAPGFFEIKVPGANTDSGHTYYVQLPPEYDPYRRYPCVVALSNLSLDPRAHMQWWTGTYDEKLNMNLGQATRYGYIVIAPQWFRKDQTEYEYSSREHAAVLSSLRDASRRFSIDTDRVFLSGHSVGGDAAWDIGLAHPDLWAGVVPIVAAADKYVVRYWENGRLLPMYFVTGELDGDKMGRNSPQFDRYLTKVGYDVMITEYQGRGAEHFQEELPRILEWMNLHQRGPLPKEFRCISMRPWDNFFWYAELRDFPTKSMILPTNWPGKGASPQPVHGKIQEANGVLLEPGGAKGTLWLSPTMVDFEKRITINGRSSVIKPSLQTILEDVRSRGDRQHPYWAKVEL
ncbi:MAG: peptidase [Planctomycetota bacterium]